MCVEFRSDEIATKAEKKDREYLIHCNLLYFVCSVVQRHLPCQPKTLINKIKLPSQLCHICVMCICAHNGCDFFAIAQPSNGYSVISQTCIYNLYIRQIAATLPFCKSLSSLLAALPLFLPKHERADEKFEHWHRIHAAQ